MIRHFDFLAQVAKDNAVTVLFAVESGSRAWGFPSPDSDFDIRFIYARPIETYLSLKSSRDVIEHTEGDLDLGGWDVFKALRLMLNGNHAIREWLRSPIQYVITPFYESFLELAQHTPSHVRLTYSYRSLLHKTLRDYLPLNEKVVPLKKYFYALRSALVIEWLRTHDELVPPMCLSELMVQPCVNGLLRAEIEWLLKKKLITVELGTGPRLPHIDKFIFHYDTNEPLPTAEPHTDELIERYDAVARRAISKAALCRFNAT